MGNENKKRKETRTEIARLGEFGLIRELTAPFTVRNSGTVMGPGDDAAVLLPCPACPEYTLLTTDLLLEGIHFDLTYFPLKHLGYKTVVIGCSDIYAMNGTPRQMTLSLGVSAKFSVEQLRELYEGVRAACDDYGIDLAGGDTSSSLTGLTLGITVIGSVAREKIVYRNGAKLNDLICITGDLGAAYMGLHLLEREKRALAGVKDPQPQFSGYEYLLRRQLKPSARREVIEELDSAGIVPTSMIDLSDGLASDLPHIMELSGVGATIHLERIPAPCTLEDALTGGEDYKLLFTARPEDWRTLCGAYRERFGTEPVAVGEITRKEGDAGPRIAWCSEGRPVEGSWQGFSHF